MRRARTAGLIPPPHASDEPTDTKCGKRRCVGTLLDDVADIVLGVDGAAPYRVDGLARTVLGLTIEILRRSGRLVEQTLGLGLGVAGDAAEAFLHLAAQV